MAKHRVRPAGLLADEGLGDEAVPSFERKKAAATIAPKKPATAKPRKLSKKAAVAAQYSDADSCRTHVSQWLAKAGAEIAAKHGGDLAVHVAGKEHELIRGIPFPHLCLEYLFQNSVLPIGGRVTQVVGPPGSCKTALAIEIGRWFVDAGGVVIYCEHESKYSPDWAPSILGWERQNSFMLHKCHSINEWQSAALDWSKQIQKMMYGEPPKNPGPGAVFPVLNIVDSIMGKSMEESQSRVLEAGHAGRDHPVEASSITKFMRTYPQQVALWPFHLVMVNHLRVSKDEAGLRVRDKPGGWQKDFQETFEVESTPIAQTHLADSDGVRLQLKTYKNSLGTKERWIEVNVRWWEEDDPTHPGKYRLKTEWDWPEATLLLLAEQLQPESRRNRVKNILDLKFPNKTSRTVYSKRLGIKKDNPVSYEEAVAKISADAELMQSLRRALGVKQYPVFIPGMDFREQMLGSKAAAAAAYKAEIERNAAKAKKNPSDDDAKPSIGEQVLQSLTAQDFGKLAQQRFENALVEKILLRYPCGADMKEHLRHQCRTPAGSWMTFDAFWNSYSNRFPVYLFVRRFNKIVADTPLHRLADRFTSCRVTKYLLDAAEDAPASQPGLAFHWPFMKNKHSVTRAGAAMVLHQLDLPEFDDVPGLEVRFRDRDRLWRIAPLGFFLEGLSLAGVFRI